MKVLPKKAEALPIGWRPDFRDRELLPDTKVVRTSFFVTVAFIAVAVGFVSYLGFREFQRSGVEESLASLHHEIDGMRVEHTSRVDSNRAFMDSFGRITEMKSLRENQLIGSDLLIAVGSSLSPKMVLTSLEYNLDGIALKGTLDVGAKDANEIMDTYISALKEADAGQGRYKNYNLKQMRREGALMVFELSIKKLETPNKKKGR